MILNLLRVEALKVEEMIKRSFSENASQQLLPEQQKQIIEVTRLLVVLGRDEAERDLRKKRIWQSYRSCLVRFAHKISRNTTILPSRT